MRGVASAELLTELVEVAQIDLVLALARHGARPLVNELEALSVSTFTVEASPLARSASKQTRAQNRTRVWNRHLRNAREIRDACSRTVVPEERLAVE
jgi:polynucleotide 5'-kinase involved in rRNA processing